MWIYHVYILRIWCGENLFRNIQFSLWISLIYYVAGSCISMQVPLDRPLALTEWRKIFAPTGLLCHLCQRHNTHNVYRYRAQSCLRTHVIMMKFQIPHLSYIDSWGPPYNYVGRPVNVVCDPSGLCRGPYIFNRVINNKGVYLSTRDTHKINRGLHYYGGP